jgi:hypothetical protein
MSESISSALLLPTRLLKDFPITHFFSQILLLLPHSSFIISSLALKKTALLTVKKFHLFLNHMFISWWLAANSSNQLHHIRCLTHSLPCIRLPK